MRINIIPSGTDSWSWKIALLKSRLFGVVHLEGCYLNDYIKATGTAANKKVPLFEGTRRKLPRGVRALQLPLHAKISCSIRPTRRHAPISPSCGLDAAPSLCRLVPG